MLTSLIVLALAAFAHAQSPSFGPCPTVKTQDTLDLEKYLGTWYEIYSFPTTFEKGTCTRAKYTKKPDGHIQVYNRGIDNGKEVAAYGDAYRPDDKEQGKLLVRFAEGTPYGNYWVVHTDYNYTLIYSCSSIVGVAHIEFAWILARNMTLPQETTKSLMSELASYQVDVSKFVATNQTACPP